MPIHALERLEQVIARLHVVLLLERDLPEQVVGLCLFIAGSCFGHGHKLTFSGTELTRLNQQINQPILGQAPALGRPVSFVILQALVLNSRRLEVIHITIRITLGQHD